MVVHTLLKVINYSNINPTKISDVQKEMVVIRKVVDSGHCHVIYVVLHEKDKVDCSIVLFQKKIGKVN